MIVIRYVHVLYSTVSWFPPLPVEVHELEEVSASLRAHGGAEQEEHDAQARGEQPPPRPEVTGEHVHDPRHEALHDAELAVDTDRLE